MTGICVRRMRRIVGQLAPALLLAACSRGSEALDVPGPPPLEYLEPVVAEAVEAARQAVAEAPESAEAWGRLGGRLAAHQWYREAAHCYAQAERLEPERFVWPYTKGRMLFFFNLPAAAEALAVAIRLDDSYAQVHLLHARTLQRLGKLSEARAEYLRATALDPGLSHAWLGLGMLDFEQDRLDDARMNLERALELDARHGAAHFALAQVYRAMNDEPEANRHARLALETDSDPPPIPDPRGRPLPEPVGYNANFKYGLKLLKRGQLESAATHFERALQADPNRASANYKLARVREQQDRTQEAMDLCLEALRHNPNHPETHHLLGALLSREGRDAEAITHFEHTLEVWPEFARAHLDLGIALLRLDRVDEATGHLRRAVEIEGDDATANYYLAFALARRGEVEEMTSYLRRAAELAPDNEMIRRRLQQVTTDP